MRRRSDFWLAAGLGLGFLGSPAASSAHEIFAKDLEIRHPFTRESAETLASKVAVYMVIRNTGAQADRLIAVRSPFARLGELVRNDPSNPTGDGIDLPPHSETTVGPNATYVLFRDMTEPLVGYQYFPATLVFEKAGAVEIEIYVEDLSETQSP